MYIYVEVCTHVHAQATDATRPGIHICTYIYAYIYIYVYVNVYIQLVISRAEWAEKHSIVEKKREEKGRGTIAMNVVEYREGQAVVQWMRFEAQRKGALRSIEHYPRKRVLGVRVNKESQGNRARVTPIHSTRTRCF